jgi:hypothetical protein
MKAGLKAEGRFEGQAQGGARAQEKGEAEEAEEKKLCPRCNQPYSYIESYTKGSQKYYVAVHYEGYQKAEGKVKKRVRKCYLGPQVYKYVEKLHELGLSGPIDKERFKRYFKELLDQVDLSPRELISMIEELGSRLLEDLDLTEADEGLADRLKDCYQLLLKAWGKVKTRLYEERFASRAT